MKQLLNLSLFILLQLFSFLALSSKVQSFAFTNINIGKVNNIKGYKSRCRHSKSSKSQPNKMMMCMKTTNNNEDTDSITKTTLASSFVIYIKDSNTKYDPTVWTLVPLDKVVGTQQQDDGKSNENGIGSLAIKALQTSLTHQQYDDNNNDNNSIKLTCNFTKQPNEYDIMTVTAVIPSAISDDEFMSYNNKNKDDLNLLVATISRIMIQKKAREYEITSSSSSSSSYISITLPSINGILVNEIFQSKDLFSSNDNTCNPSIYKSILPSNIDLKSIEMSDMVDSNGDIIGSLPRILVHKLNILHRGIGIVVCNNDHITKNFHLSKSIADNIQIYCHRRTETKRIFPNLYDMFVGGVSISGEDSILTASREVAEELGLDKALRCIESSSNNNNDNNTEPSPLSEPLFQCTVCTSYNRCVVTVFTYKYNSTEEDIKWQEEEVSWGDFVPYNFVEKAAALSIKRLIEDGKWPGTGYDDEIKFFETLSQDVFSSSNNQSLKWYEWDFVPDGLLVWVAWLQWLRKREL